MEVKLDSEQKEAIEHEGGPLLIVAGPGSGKTMVLTERVRHLVNVTGAKPEEILCLTFTDKAAGEMRKRLEQFGMDTSNMDVGTFHSFAKKVLEDNELDTGLDTSGGVIEKAEAIVWAINNIDNFNFENVEVGNNAFGLMGAMMDGISAFAKALLTADDIDLYITNRSPGKNEGEKEQLENLADLSKVYRAYQKFKRDKHVIDYDDMVSEAIRLFKKKTSICHGYRTTYTHILVDELQDNNLAQFHLVKMLANSGNVTGVGDEDQSIYSFQGAYAEIFADFKENFSINKPNVLKTNYRSTENIVRITNDWMLYKGKTAKELHSTDRLDGDTITVARCDDNQSEAECVAERISKLASPHLDGKAEADAGKFCNYRDIAILTRKKIDGEKFEKALVERGIPARYVGSTNLLSEEIVRDLMAHIKVAAMPAMSGIDITHLMKLHGITERNIARINRAAKTRMFSSSRDGGDCVLATIRGEGMGRPKTTQDAEMCEFQTKLDKLVRAGDGSLPVDKAVYKIMMSISGLYRNAIADNTRRGEEQVQRLNEVYRIAQVYTKIYPDAGLSGFAKHLYQMGEQEDEARYSLAAEDAVEIMTIHQSKGKEFEVVFVADVSARKLPVTHRARKFDVPDDILKDSHLSGTVSEKKKKEMHLDEERRLLYVAMTRAKSKLFITYVEQSGDDDTKPKQSVFLNELDESEEYQIRNKGSRSQPLILKKKYKDNNTGKAIKEPGVVEKRTRDTQAKAIAAVGGMSLKTAVHHIVELSRIKYRMEHGGLDGFDPKEVLNTDEIEASYEEAEWVGNLGNEQGLIDADSFEFSASKIDLYKKCPLQFKFRHVLHVPEQPGAPMDVGAAVHAVLEKIAKRRANGKKTNEKEAFDLLKKHWKYTSFENRKTLEEEWDAAKEMIRTFMKWDQRVAVQGTEIVDIEKKFKMEIDGLKFTGKIDRVDKEPGGRYVVTDYKTGRTPTSKSKIGHDVQLNLYALATESIYGELPSKTTQLFVRKGKEISNEINARVLAEEKETMLGMARAILDGQFIANPSYMGCQWCSYVQICDDRYPGSEKRR